MTGIKPCPFCGGTQIYTSDHMLNERTISCGECRASIRIFADEKVSVYAMAHWPEAIKQREHTLDKAIAAWNRRADK